MLDKSWPERMPHSASFPTIEGRHSPSGELSPSGTAKEGKVIWLPREGVLQSDAILQERSQLLLPGIGSLWCRWAEFPLDMLNDVCQSAILLLLCQLLDGRSSSQFPILKRSLRVWISLGLLGSKWTATRTCLVNTIFDLCNTMPEWLIIIQSESARGKYQNLDKVEDVRLEPGTALRRGRMQLLALCNRLQIVGVSEVQLDPGLQLKAKTPHLVADTFIRETGRA